MKLGKLRSSLLQLVVLEEPKVTGLPYDPFVEIRELPGPMPSTWLYPI